MGHTQGDPLELFLVDTPGNDAEQTLVNTPGKLAELLNGQAEEILDDYNFDAMKPQIFIIGSSTPQL